MNDEYKLPSIKENFSDWYNEVIYKSELIEHVSIKGCIVIRPYGYAIWEKMQQVLDCGIKKMGAKNAAFPLLIPHSLIEAEKDHVVGFAPEIAVVTHAGGKKIEEPLVVRPTSEVIIHSMFSKWIKSWRDLPIKVNQWCSVVRWEKRPRPFIRTTEFWWQEGHTAHETCKEAYDQAHEAWNLYENFIRDYLSIPVICGEKPAHERFAGAQATFTLEGMMQDGKALQMGTSHILGKGFSENLNIKFLNKEGKEEYAYLTSWGVTTRMIGALIMVHGDEKGLILPPKVATIQFVIIPILKSKDDNEIKNKILEKSKNIKNILESIGYSVEIDINENETPGNKFYKWEMKGVPFRIEIGKIDLEKNTFVLFQRDILKKEFINFSIFDDLNELKKNLSLKIEEFHARLFKKAENYLLEKSYYVDDINEFGEKLSNDGGFYITNICQTDESIEKIKSFSGTIRCLLKESHKYYKIPKKNCCVHGKECNNKNILSPVLVAKAY